MPDLDARFLSIFAPSYTLCDTENKKRRCFSNQGLKSTSMPTRVLQRHDRGGKSPYTKPSSGTTTSRPLGYIGSIRCESRQKIRVLRI